MIRYDGIIEREKIHYLMFANDQGVKASIPLDKLTAELIRRHLSKISTSEGNPPKRNNDEESD